MYVHINLIIIKFDNYFQIHFDVTNISLINKTYNKTHNYKYSLYP